MTASIRRTFENYASNCDLRFIFPLVKYLITYIIYINKRFKYTYQTGIGNIYKDNIDKYLVYWIYD